MNAQELIQRLENESRSNGKELELASLAALDVLATVSTEQLNRLIQDLQNMGKDERSRQALLTLMAVAGWLDRSSRYEHNTCAFKIFWWLHIEFSSHDAGYNVALALHLGKGCKQDHKRAFQIASTILRTNQEPTLEAPLLLLLSEMYDRGLGVARNGQIAVSLMRQAVESQPNCAQIHHAVSQFQALLKKSFDQDAPQEGAVTMGMLTQVLSGQDPTEQTDAIQYIAHINLYGLVDNADPVFGERMMRMAVADGSITAQADLAVYQDRRQRGLLHLRASNKPVDPNILEMDHNMVKYLLLGVWPQDSPCYPTACADASIDSHQLGLIAQRYCDGVPAFRAEFARRMVVIDYLDRLRRMGMTEDDFYLALELIRSPQGQEKLMQTEWQQWF